MGAAPAAGAAAQPFVAQPQPFVQQPLFFQQPAQHGPGAQIGFNYAQLPPLPQGGGNPLAFVPVFGHEEDMDLTPW